MRRNGASIRLSSVPLAQLADQASADVQAGAHYKQIYHAAHRYIAHIIRRSGSLHKDAGERLPPNKQW